GVHLWPLLPFLTKRLPLNNLPRQLHLAHKRLKRMDGVLGGKKMAIQKKREYLTDGRNALSLTPVPDNPLEKGRGGGPMTPPPPQAPTPPKTAPPPQKK